MAIRRWSSALVVVLIIGSMAVAGEAAHAQPVEFEARQSLWKEMTVDGQGALPPPGDSPDADQHAKLTGLSSAAAAVDLQKQILFETTATAIVESEPDSAIQFGFKNDRTPWISFKGKLSERAKSQLSRLPFSTSVRYGGSASIAELHLAQSVIADNLETVPRIKRSTGGIDPETLSIWVRYELEPGSPDLSIYESNKVLASVAALSGDGLLPSQIQLKSGAVDIKPERILSGGENLDATDGSGTCTAGFTVTNGSQSGLVTARHCPNYMKFNGLSGIIAYNSATSPSEERDLQWHNTINGNTVRNQIKIGTAPTYRVITSTANPGLGSTVCIYGRTTARTRCSTVTNSATYYYDGSQRYAGIVETADYITLPGDSGGPWFINNAARGIHSAGSGTNSYFTWITSVSYLDVGVKTS